MPCLCLLHHPARREGAAARDAQRAADAEVAAAALRTQLADAEAQLGEERGRNEELVGLLYPLTAKLKALEAAGGG